MTESSIGPGAMAALPLASDIALDRQILEMRRVLAKLKGASAADALRALRTQFPDAPLAARTRVLGERRT